MKTIFPLIFTLFITSSSLTAQNDSDDDNLLPNSMFSVEGGYHFSDLNGKHAIDAKAYVWFLRKNSLGPEFKIYMPSAERDYFDYQIDFNFRRILVDFHPLTFDFLIGPAFRSTLDSLNSEDEYVGQVAKDQRALIFDGFNLGFGVGYRWGNHSIYGMPKINHKDAFIQLSVGYKYHFNIYTADVFDNKYKLRKKRRRD